MCMIIYYHYTDREGLKGILKARKILKSPSGRYGEGVYLTRLAPTHGRAKIAQNNWDGVWKATEGSGKVDYTISVRLPDHKVKTYGEIFVFSEDVDLDFTTYRLYSKSGDHEELENAAKKTHEEDEEKRKSQATSQLKQRKMKWCRIM
ncbi:uncharacterized protein LOC143280167 isoform X3 [Babylonia areolata]